jgi:hypothetical protein
MASYLPTSGKGEISATKAKQLKHNGLLTYHRHPAYAPRT